MIGEFFRSALLPVNLDVPTPVEDAGHILRGCIGTQIIGNRYSIQNIIRDSAVVINFGQQAVVPKSHFNAHIRLCSSLPPQVGIGQLQERSTVVEKFVRPKHRTLAQLYAGRIIKIAYAVVTRLTPAKP